jgi:hypothetical protein
MRPNAKIRDSALAVFMLIILNAIIDPRITTA